MALQHAAGDGVIISTAVSEARGHQARISLLHEVDTPGTLMLVLESWSLHGAEDESYLAHLEREIDDADLPVEIGLLHGSPAEAIVETLETAGIDMLVMGSHGHRGMDDKEMVIDDECFRFDVGCAFRIARCRLFCLRKKTTGRHSNAQRDRFVALPLSDHERGHARPGWIFFRGLAICRQKLNSYNRTVVQSTVRSAKADPPYRRPTGGFITGGGP